MAAVDSPTAQIAVAAIPVIVSPILAWFLSRWGISKEAATIDYLSKRLDVLERLNKLHTQLTEGPIKPFLDKEIEYCRAFLHQPPTFLPSGAEVAVAAPQSRWARFFLTQPAGSVRKRIFKGLFYFFFGIAMLFGPLGAITFFFEPEARPDPLETSLILLSSFVFYFGLALLVRLGAR
jgi:hypothetical protein